MPHILVLAKDILSILQRTKQHIQNTSYIRMDLIKYILIKQRYTFRKFLSSAAAVITGEVEVAVISSVTQKKQKWQKKTRTEL